MDCRCHKGKKYLIAMPKLAESSEVTEQADAAIPLSQVLESVQNLYRISIYRESNLRWQAVVLIILTISMMLDSTCVIPLTHFMQNNKAHA